MASYQTLAQMKVVLGNMLTTDNQRDADLQSVLDAVTLGIDQYCRRTFIATSSGTARTFQLPASDTLLIPDASAISAVSIDGTALDSTEFITMPLFITTWQPSITSLQRVTSTSGQAATVVGVPRAWAQRGSRSNATVTGTWGYQIAGAYPSVVVQVCETMAARLWKRREGAYANDKGATINGMDTVKSPIAILDADCCMLLKPLRRARPLESKPAWREQ